MTNELEGLRARVSEEHLRAPPGSEANGHRPSTILDAVLDSMCDGVAVADETGHLILYNRAAGHMLGLSTGKRLPEGWRWEDGCTFSDTCMPVPQGTMPLTRALAGEEVEGAELFVRNLSFPNGIWLSVNARPLPAVEPTQGGAVAIFRDVTVRKQAEQRSTLQQAVAASLAEGSSWHETRERLLASIGTGLNLWAGVFWEVDEAAGLLRCQALWETENLPEFPAPDTLGSAQPSIRKQVEQVTWVPGIGVPGKVWAERRAIWCSMLDRAAVESADGGGIRWNELSTVLAIPVQVDSRVLGVIEVRGQRHYPPDPELVALCQGLGESIGQFALRKRAEEALRDSEALYQSLVDSLPLFVFCKDRAGRFTFMNQRLAASIGRPVAEILGRTDADFYPADLAAKYRRDDVRVMESRTLFEDVEQYCQPDGEKKYVQVWKVPVFDARGQVVGIQGIFWDVTDRCKAEEDLKRTAAELARSNRDLDQFASIASHDLQEPLRMVSSYCQLLQRRYGNVLTGDGLEFLAFAVDGAKRMQGLINDLLSYSRIGTQRKPLKQVNTRIVVDRALANLQAAIAEKQAEVLVGDLPIILADETLLIQLFQNLIGNAIKFHGTEKPRVEISARNENHGWVFDVKDNGIGIEPQYQERVFAIFQRLHGRGEYPGTGIGLAICKRIVERHGGRIQVHSVPNEGSTFSFTLPQPEVSRT